MLTLSDKNIEILGLKNQSLLYHLVNVSNLNKKWSQENFLEIEIKKSFIRGELRYSKEGSDIANSISQIIKKNQILDGYNFFTNIYPMIHLSNDLSEKSNLHFDQHDNNDLFTCWFSITKNYYNPISILKFSNKKFKKILSKIPFPNYFLKHINPKIGYINLWDGHNLHKGNLNLSENISCAYQMKFSKKKYIFDYSEKIESNINPKTNLDSNQYLKSFQKLNYLVTSLNEINLKDNDYDSIFDLLKKNLSKQFNKKNEKISFSLSVLAQRLMTHGKKFNVKNCDQKVLLLDICSILLGSENLISLDRLCKRLIYNNVMNLDILYNSDFLNCIPKNSYEWIEILKNNKYE